MVVAFEVVKGFVLVGTDDVRNVLFRMDVADLALRHTGMQGVADSLDQVSLAEANPTINEERVIGCTWTLGYLCSRGTREFVCFAGYETLEGEQRVETGDVACRSATRVSRRGCRCLAWGSHPIGEEQPDLHGLFEAHRCQFFDAAQEFVPDPL